MIHKIVHIVTVAQNETYKEIVSDELLSNMYKNEIEINIKVYDNYDEEKNNQYVLEVNGEIIEYINIEKSSINGNEKFDELFALYILSKYKGFGFGKMLVNKSKEGLKKMGYNKMLIGCLEKISILVENMLGFIFLKNLIQMRYLFDIIVHIKNLDFLGFNYLIIYFIIHDTCFIYFYSIII